MRTMDDAMRAAVTDLQQLVADYWYDVDEHDSLTAPEFFTEDGVFEVGTGTYTGPTGVRAFYDHRALRGKRTTRHTVAVSILYAADGPAPITNFVGPAVVSDVVCVCDRNPNGQAVCARVASS